MSNGVEVVEHMDDKAFFEALERSRMDEARKDFMQNMESLVRHMTEKANSPEDLSKFYWRTFDSMYERGRFDALSTAAQSLASMPKRAVTMTVAAAQSLSSAADHLGHALALSAKSVMQSTSESLKAAWNSLAQTASSWFTKSVNLFRNAVGSLVETDKKFDAWMDAKIDAGIDATVAAAKSFKTGLQIHAGALMDVSTKATVLALETVGQKIEQHILMPVAALAEEAKDAVIEKRDDAARLARAAAQAVLQSVASKAQNMTDAAETAFNAARQSVIHQVDAAHAVVSAGTAAVAAGMTATAASYTQAVERRRAAAVASGMAAIATSMPEVASVAATSAKSDILQTAARVEPVMDVALAQGGSRAESAELADESKIDGLFAGYMQRSVARVMSEPALSADKPSIEKAEEIAEDEAEAHFGPSPMMG